MKLADHVAGGNLVFLDQGIELIRHLDDARFAGSPSKLYRGGVGAQFRHCIDFYGCFLRGLDRGRIDYARRERDPSVAASREAAIRALETVRRSLLELTPGQAEQLLEIRAEDPAPEGASPEWCRSSVGRELQFLVSHTVHHYALIAALLQLGGFDVLREFPEFGVAPSTLSHWKEGG